MKLSQINFFKGSSRISYDTTFEDNWRGSTGNFHNQHQDLKLGPGQRKPKNFVMNSPKYGELFLEFHTTKSFLEIRVNIFVSYKHNNILH